MEHKVQLNRDTAFSVFYEDDQGRLYFTFESDSAAKKIYLDPRPSLHGSLVREPERKDAERVEFAVQRVIDYFSKQGLSVETR